MIIIFEGGSEIIIVITSRVHVSCAGLSTSPSLLSVGRRAKTDHWALPLASTAHPPWGLHKKRGTAIAPDLYFRAKTQLKQRHALHSGAQPFLEQQLWNVITYWTRTCLQNCLSSIEGSLIFEFFKCLFEKIVTFYITKGTQTVLVEKWLFRAVKIFQKAAESSLNLN